MTLNLKGVFIHKALLNLHITFMNVADIIVYNISYRTDTYLYLFSCVSCAPNVILTACCGAFGVFYELRISHPLERICVEPQWIHSLRKDLEYSACH